MASKAVAPEQPRVAKQKHGQVAVRNRRVLGDIGNLVIAPAVEGKPPNQTGRRITRSTGAQLSEKPQGEAAKNGKKQQIENIDGLVGNERVPKHDKENLKTKKDDVSSSDEKESCKTESITRGRSSKKSGKTLTSVLTARSKAACGLTKKPGDDIVDIDAADAENDLAATEYVEDLYSFYKLTEEDGRVQDYMCSQPEINSKMRAILIDCLIEVHRKFELMPESLYLTVNIVDRFLSAKVVPRRELQLVGISSMLIACKYEEIWAPEVSDFIAISDNAYLREQVLLMEKAILGKLGWYLTVPTPYVFLVRYIKASIPSDSEVENMSFFLAELGMMNYSAIIPYSPSMISASAVYAARCTLKKSPVWTETLGHYTGYSADQLMECAKLLVSFHSGLSENNKLKAVERKYSKPEKGVVALFPAAKILLTKS